jgi:MazG family protein
MNNITQMRQITSASEQFARLVNIVAALRSPEGCPWDQEQTLGSLARFVLEEAYEVVEAIERDDLDGLREEIGDHIFEGVFLAEIAAGRGAFTVADALESVSNKLVRRHPHVFREDGELHDAESKSRAPSAGAALARWDAQKALERSAAGQSHTTLGSVPRSLPALVVAFKLGKLAASVGFDWVKPVDVFAKMAEEISELRGEIEAEVPNPAGVEEEMGDLLFATANLARKLGIEPETALRKANDKFSRRFTAMEAAVTASGRSLADVPLDELEAEWQRTKSAAETRGR